MTNAAMKAMREMAEVVTKSRKRMKISKRNVGRQVRLELFNDGRGLGTITQVNRGGGFLWVTILYRIFHEKYGTLLPEEYTLIWGKENFDRITIV